MFIMQSSYCESNHRQYTNSCGQHNFIYKSRQWARLNPWAADCRPSSRSFLNKFSFLFDKVTHGWISQLVTSCRGRWVDQTLTKMDHCRRQWPLQLAVWVCGVTEPMIVTGPVKRVKAGPRPTPVLSPTPVVSFTRGPSGLLLVTHSFSGRRVCPTPHPRESCFASCESMLWLPSYSGAVMPGKHRWFKQQTPVVCPGRLMAHVNAGVSFPFRTPKISLHILRLVKETGVVAYCVCLKFVVN